MDGPLGSSHPSGRSHSSDPGDNSPKLDDGSEDAQSSNKYRRTDQEGSRSPAPTEQASRFLFVDSSSTGQRPRSDQRAINAHIQQTAHRNRRQATRKQKLTGIANISRNRHAPILQPRPVGPQHTASVALAQRGLLSRPSSASSAATSVTPSTTDLRTDYLSPAPQEQVSPRSSPGFEAEQLDRLRYYSSARRQEVEDVLRLGRDEQSASSDVVRRANADEETDSVRSMLTRILQRLDAGHGSHSIPGTSNSSLRNTALDPFNISSVPITPAMNTALRHCK